MSKPLAKSTADRRPAAKPAAVKVTAPAPAPAATTTTKPASKSASKPASGSRAIPTEAKTLALVKQYFGDWKGTAIPPAPTGKLPEPARSITVVDRPGSAQVDIAMGHLSVIRTNQDYFPLIVASSILGGGASLLAHGGKAGARAVVNASPEPFSNAAVSTVEDVATSGLLYLAYSHPVVAGGIALGLAVFTALLLVLAWRVLRRIFLRVQENSSPSGEEA